MLISLFLIFPSTCNHFPIPWSLTHREVYPIHFTHLPISILVISSHLLIPLTVSNQLYSLISTLLSSLQICEQSASFNAACNTRNGDLTEIIYAGYEGSVNLFRMRYSKFTKDPLRPVKSQFWERMQQPMTVCFTLLVVYISTKPESLFKLQKVCSITLSFLNICHELINYSCHN